MLRYKLTYNKYNAVNLPSTLMTAWVHPSDEGIKIKHKPERGQLYHRGNLEGKLVFYNNDAAGINEFAIFSNMAAGADSSAIMIGYYFYEPTCTIEVYRPCDNLVPYITGTFSIYDGEIDFDRETFTVTPKLTDEYTPVDEFWEVEKNIINIGTQTLSTGYICSGEQAFTAEYDVYLDYVTLTQDIIVQNSYQQPGGQWVIPQNPDKDPVDQPSDFFTVWQPRGYVFFEGSYEFSQTIGSDNYFTAICTYVADTRITFDIAGVAQVPDQGLGGAWIGSTPVVVAALRGHRYSRTPEGLLKYKRVFPGTGEPGDPAHFELLSGLDAGNPITYNHARKFEDVCNYLLEDAGLTIRSRFFFDSLNPVLEYYKAFTGQATYINNPLNNLLVIQNTDVTNYIATASAAKAMIKLGDWLDDLCKTFNLGWFIEGTELVIEHDLYFSYGDYPYFSTAPIYGNVTDLTTQDYRKWTRGLVAFAFDDNSRIDIERFSSPNSFYIDHVGTPIDYSQFTNRKDRSKEYDLKNIGTDLLYLQDFANEAEKLGVLMVACDLNAGIYTVHKETAKLSGFAVSNAHLGWGNLHWNYWRSGRFGQRYVVNGIASVNYDYPVTAWTLLRPFSFPVCCGGFNPDIRVRIQSGTRTLYVKVAEAEEDLNSEMVTIKGSVTFTTIDA